MPDSICDRVFDKELKRGVIVKTLLNCADEKNRPHYFVALNHNITEDPLVFVVATSRRDFYDKNPQFDREIVRIAPKQVSCFPLYTIIDVKRVFQYSKDELKERYRRGTLAFVGALSPDLLGTIDQIVRKSYFLSPREKALILGQAPN